MIGKTTFLLELTHDLFISQSSSNWVNQANASNTFL